MKKKIAVIGAGFFGSVSAIMLSKYYKVDLFEKNSQILCGASRANQFRFHLGYHYPRSKKTVDEIKLHFKEFYNYFGKNVFGTTNNYYGIAKINSKTNFKEYLHFLKKNKLKYKQINSIGFNEKQIAGQLISYEKNLNYFKIKKIIENKLKNKNINLYLKKEFKKKNINEYDKIIVACYDQNNTILKKLGCVIKKKFRYELVEKIIIKLPKKYRNKSYMVLDGNFVCLDPYLGTKFHLLSDVKNSKLEITKNKYPNFKHLNKKFLNKEIIKFSKFFNFKKFIKNSSKYLPFLDEAKYYGSFYVTRAIKKDKEKTDERLNEISLYGDKFISIFSGKWNTCIGVAKNITHMIKND